MKNSLLVLALWLGIATSSFAIEGMWIPSLIDMFYSDMKTKGLKLKPEDIYATNKSSLKDAIVQFNGGCTAELVSDQGLLLTNHHCGFSAIQQLSSLQNDYLKEGFWAKNRAEELPCAGMYVTFVKEIKDVTRGVLDGVTEEMSEQERTQTIQGNIVELETEAAKEAGIKAKIKPFFKGNQYFMLVTRDYTDIRLVGAPPSAIGKFGGDTDNWVWPRHTGDFAVFRIYANGDNEPATYAENNKAFKPAHFLPISMKEKKQGDFTMVYGFPGSTNQHYVSDKLDYIIKTERPARIKMRQMALDVINPAMQGSDAIRIQYASKQARIANAWKKWIGQIAGLRELKAVDKKQAWEAEYTQRANSKEAWKEEYGTVVAELKAIHEKYQNYHLARSLFIEYFYVGNEFMTFAMRFYDLANKYEDLASEEKLEAELESLRKAAKSFFKDYNKDIDRAIVMAKTPYYIEQMDPELLPNGFSENWANMLEEIFSESILLDEENLLAFLEDFDAEKADKLSADPALDFATLMQVNYVGRVAPLYQELNTQEQELLQRYVDGLLTMFPNRSNWSDANSTMRIAYGVVDGSAPHDGMKYLHYTTIDGIMQKHATENPDFELTDRFIELYEKGDFGDYTQDGELWVCFTASNHTTGGNSGSPVIDAKGRLMGINFDRSWESTMSDFMFDESRCRNIVVDIRYVLWVIDHYGEAGHLVEEMKLVK